MNDPQRPPEPLYDEIGEGYDVGRRRDPAIGRRIDRALRGAGRVVDIGTGTGNYSPTDRFCVGVDPSRRMLDERAAAGGHAVQAIAEDLPFNDRVFDAALGVLTAHHWSNLEAGLHEMRRTSARQVLFIREPFTGPEDFWLLEYFPGFLDAEAARTYPSEHDLRRHLRVDAAEPIAIASDCRDGFLGCFWNQPEAFLSDEVRRCISIFSFLEPAAEAAGVERLAADLSSGRWEANHGELRRRSELHIGHKLVTAG